MSQAMDAIQQFADCGYCDSYATWKIKSKGQPSPVTQFVVGGASKRGWTTWTTGVGDMRVAAIVPVVMDLLNLLPNAGECRRKKWPQLCVIVTRNGDFIFFVSSSLASCVSQRISGQLWADGLSNSRTMSRQVLQAN